MNFKPSLLNRQFLFFSALSSKGKRDASAKYESRKMRGARRKQASFVCWRVGREAANDNDKNKEFDMFSPVAREGWLSPRNTRWLPLLYDLGKPRIWKQTLHHSEVGARSYWENQPVHKTYIVHVVKQFLYVKREKIKISIKKLKKISKLWDGKRNGSRELWIIENNMLWCCFRAGN